VTKKGRRQQILQEMGRWINPWVLVALLCSMFHLEQTTSPWNSDLATKPGTKLLISRI